MIVRINQIELAKLQTEGGWSAGPLIGPLPPAWPADARAFELLILSQDEKQQPLTDAFRQHQLRQMIPQAAIALSAPEMPQPGEAASFPPPPILLRLDGPVADDELLPAWRHLKHPDGSGRFGFSSCVKVDDAPDEVIGSVRVEPSWKHLSQICNDSRLGLERSVRLRMLSLPGYLIPEALEISAANDPRWEHVLGECAMYLGTTAKLTALHLVVRQMDAPQVKARVMQRLLAVARGEPAIP